METLIKRVTVRQMFYGIITTLLLISGCNAKTNVGQEGADDPLVIEDKPAVEEAQPVEEETDVIIEGEPVVENAQTSKGEIGIIIDNEPLFEDPQPGQGGTTIIIDSPNLTDPLPGEVISTLPPVNTLEELPVGMTYQDYYLQYIAPEINLIANEYNRLYSEYMGNAWSFNEEDAYGRISNNMFSLVNAFAALQVRLDTMVFLDSGPNGQYLEAYRYNMRMSMDCLIEYGHQTQHGLDGVQDSYSTNLALQNQITQANSYVETSNAMLKYYEAVTLP